jgi:hypothetical protein
MQKKKKKGDLEILLLEGSKMLDVSQVWWLMPVVLPLQRLRQEDPEFHASVGYVARPCVKAKQNKTKKGCYLKYKV